MAIPHADSGEVLDISLPAGKLNEAQSRLLIRADHLEVFRLVLPAGKEPPPHTAAGAITIQCLKGAVELEVHATVHELRAGHLVYLKDAEPHRVRAIEDSALLITVLLNRL